MSKTVIVKNFIKIKNILLLLSFMILFVAPANAKATQVEAMTPYNSDTPADTILFKIVSPTFIEDFGSLEQGDVIDATIVRAKDNTRLKQNATFSVKIYKITYTNGETKYPENLYAKYTTEWDKVETSKSVALSVGNRFVKGLTFGYRTVEGAIKNPEGNRAKSAGVALYNATPLSLISKGEGLEIKTGDNFLLNIEYIPPEKQNLIDEHNYNL